MFLHLRTVYLTLYRGDRKYFRRWMQHVGVAVPWLSGFLTGFIPDLVSTSFQDGVCPYARKLLTTDGHFGLKTTTFTRVFIQQRDDCPITI